MTTFRIRIAPRTLHFRNPAMTSRGVYRSRRIWLLTLSADEMPGVEGVGECAPLPQLSCDDLPDYEEILQQACDNFCTTGRIDSHRLRAYPSILFALETALAQWQHGGNTALSDTPFARGEEGIPINGLVWMGTFCEMATRLEEKLRQGFRCVKLKIGAIDFEQEIELLRRIRQTFDKEAVELRLDANGAFRPDEALNKLERLAHFDIHSIEQPIRQGQWNEMAQLCRLSAVPIALDEELIGIHSAEQKRQLLDTIHPAYIILKPTLHGGISGCTEWISLAAERGIGSWATSALESNVGLNAIAHFAAQVYGPRILLPQGLGTGLLFTDNISRPLQIKENRLWYLPNG